LSTVVGDWLSQRSQHRHRLRSLESLPRGSGAVTLIDKKGELVMTPLPDAVMRAVSLASPWPAPAAIAVTSGGG